MNTKQRAREMVVEIGEKLVEIGSSRGRMNVRKLTDLSDKLAIAVLALSPTTYVDPFAAPRKRSSRGSVHG